MKISKLVTAVILAASVTACSSGGSSSGSSTGDFNISEILGQNRISFSYYSGDSGTVDSSFTRSNITNLDNGVGVSDSQATLTFAGTTTAPTACVILDTNKSLITCVTAITSTDLLAFVFEGRNANATGQFTFCPDVYTQADQFRCGTNVVADPSGSALMVTYSSTRSKPPVIDQGVDLVPYLEYAEQGVPETTTTTTLPVEAVVSAIRYIMQ